MLPLGLHRLLISSVGSLLLASLSPANEPPAELKQAQAQFQKEVDFALRPMRGRYVARLQTLKRTLISKGDLRGAVAVQDEIDLTVATANETEIRAKLVGTWTGEFKGERRSYVVKTDGTVDWLKHDNGLLVTGQLQRRGKDFIFFWETIEETHRVSLTETGGLEMDVFISKDAYANGSPIYEVPLSRSAIKR